MVRLKKLLPWVLALAVPLIVSPAILAHADQVEFEDEAWKSLPPFRDSSVVVAGDIDLDGDLDLIFGDRLGGIVIFHNQFGRLVDREPEEVPNDVVSAITSIALGDINGDGFPELVCGHEQAPVTVHWNVAGSFPSVPTSIGPSLSVSKLVLADLDNDRDLDLVIGADGEADRWLPNEGGELKADLAVILGAAGQTRGVSVGDLDQDGWLDLFMAMKGQGHRFYYNRFGDLNADPDSMEYGGYTPTTAAMGDLGNDGLMDLVVFSETNRAFAYINNGDRTFSSPPDVGSGPRAATDIALADLDRDGFLDVVFTTDSTQVPVAWLRFLNGAWTAYEELGRLPQEQIQGGMTGLALVDLDEDGDLDLAGSSGTQAGESILWRVGGILESEASWPPPGSWAAGDMGTTYGLALVDLDLDNDLDVVQGRFADPVPEPNSIYLNQDGVIGTEPVWTAVADTTTSLVVADWDMDGYPDLLFGNKRTGGIHLHRNRNGVIDPVPEILKNTPTNVWSLAVVDLDNDGFNDLVEGGVDEVRVSFRDPAGDGFTKTSVVGAGQASSFYNYLDFADVDGDGDLDFAGAQSNGLEVVFRNNFTTGATADTLWLAPSVQIGGFVSLADLDGDQAPDLTVGYAGTQVDNEWFRGSQGTFDDLGRPWGDNAYPTWEAEMSDWDGDGFRDLLEAEEGGPNRLLKNRSGVIDKVGRSLWTSADNAGTYRLAAGDLDRDGDLDLWVGNRQEPDQIFRGVINPGPTNPGGVVVPLKPGSPAHLRKLASTSDTANQVVVTCEAVDREADGLVVVARFRPTDSVTWIPAETHTLTTSMDGLAQQLSFDSSAWPASPAGYILQLRSVEVSRRLAEFRHAPRYELHLASAGISRPEIVFSRQGMAMPTMTEGGTADTSFVVTNAGNEILQVSGSASRMDLVLDPESGSVAPGGSLIMNLTFSPLDTTGNGFVVLSSNDPLSPADTLMVTTDIRRLAFGFNFLLEGGAVKAPLGESLTGLLAPADGVDMEEGWLHYRQAGGATFLSLPLSPLEKDWVAVIPGNHVTEAGIEYYLEVRNGAKTVTDPEVNPGQSPRLMEVEAPTGLTSLVQSHSDAGILADRDVFIRVVPPPGTILTQGAVHYRVGGAVDFQIISLQPDSTALIPAAAVGERGLEYHIVANSLAAELRDPPTGEHQIRVNVANLAEPSAAGANQYRMVSVPLDFGDFSGTIGDLVGDQPEFGPYEITRWRCFRYLPDTRAYGELSNAGLAEVFRPAPGKAFWLIASEANRLNTSPVSGRSVASGSSYTVTVPEGWSQVANPFAYPISWDNVLVTDLSGAPAETQLSGPISGGYGDISVLQPFSGFWVKNFQEENLRIHFAPIAHVTEEKSEFLKAAWDWSVELKAESTRAGSASATVAVVSGAGEGWDRLDQPLAPAAPDQKLRIFLTNWEWPSREGNYSKDVRPPPDLVEHQGISWTFAVDLVDAETTAAEVELSFANLASLPEGMEAVLIDRELLQSVAVTGSSRYLMVARRASTEPEAGRFLLAIGTEEFLQNAADEQGQLPPRQTILLQNAPNPFNPSTVIHYELAQTGTVRLNIYDLRGLRVRDLVAESQTPGRYQVLWDGRDNHGGAAGAGVYFARLEATDGPAGTIKMVLLK